MSAFVLKIIAVISMFSDHFGDFLYNGNVSVFNYFGRIAFPIFAFQITEGYAHTHSLKNYFKKLFIFSLISQIPYNLFQYAVGFNLNLNIFFTLLLGLLAITLFDKLIHNKNLNNFIAYILGLASVAGCCLLAHFLNTDYGYWGVLLIYIFYIFKGNKILMFIAYTFMVGLKFGQNLIEYNFYLPYVLLALGTLSAIIPILLYNGKLGPKLKYFLYIFYPAHLLILAIIKLAIA